MFLVTDFSSILRWNIIIQNHKLEIPSDSMGKSSRGGPLYCCNKEHEVSQVLEFILLILNVIKWPPFTGKVKTCWFALLWKLHIT